MSTETLKKSIDFLMEKRTNAHLTFFGGEPLLCKELIISGIEYGNLLAKENNGYIAYSIVTNGTNMDEKFIEILNKNNVNIIYSFDGNEYSQNKYRPFNTGKGSYDIVYENLKLILKTRKDERYGHFIVRPTITSEMIPLLPDIYHELVSLGCKEISFSLVSADQNKSYAIKENDLQELRVSYKKMIDEYYNELLNGYSYNKFFEGILDRIMSDYTNKTFCDCGKRYIAIDVNGNAYPCEGFIGVKDYKIGNIYTNEIINEWNYPQNVEENIKCNQCWAKYLCGGSCYHEAWMRTGSINNRDNLVCETYRISFEYALQLFAKLYESKENISLILKKVLLQEKSIPFIDNSILKKIDNNKLYVGDGINNRIINLNETASKVFDLCDNNNTITEIASAIIEEFECEYDIYADISEIIDTFINAGIMHLRV